MFKKKSIKKSSLYPIVVLENGFSHRFRHHIYKFAGNTTILFTVITFAFYILSGSATSVASEYTTILEVWMPKISGVALLAFCLWAVAFLLEGFFRSYYFKGMREGEDIFTFDILTIFNKTKKGDVTKAFLLSDVGARVMFRLGVGKKSIKTFLKERKPVALLDEEVVSSNEKFGLKDIIILLLEKDEEFSSFLFQQGLTQKDCIGAAGWIVREEEKEKYVEKWWSRDRLAKVRPLGEDWSYGQTYALNKYSKDMMVSGRLFSDDFKHEKETLQLESVLSRVKEANAIIVGEDGVGKMDLVYDLARRILKKIAPETLQHKRIVVLNSDILIASTGDKITFERETLRLFEEAIRAGNIILVLEDFPSFILSAQSLGSDVMNIIDAYLGSTDIQLIATSSVEGFHQSIEGNPTIMRRFEKIVIEEPDENTLSAILEDVAVELERSYGIIFTYPAILEAIISVRNYFPDAVMPEKAIDLLVEVAPMVRQKGSRFVEKKDILDLVSAKTNIPMGEIGEEEKDKLLRLEEILHQRIIGQEEAVKLISGAMRRARTGVRDPKKPIGSFLFIGPTGVGKTETAKALAHVFFGDEGAVARLDMSEYQTDDALTRLIGSFEEGKMGSLSKILKEKPYGVLLLDEFEKTNPDIHDLFLQILDEGFFSDMKGKRVNARNIIFIATSNAGSDMIWEAVKSGKKIPEMKDELVGEIIKRGRFKPELLNRFDGVVLFHPLEKKHLEKIAALMLEGLRKRLRERGIDLVVNNALVNYVMSEGVDRVFGARPMKRIIQEKVEQRIAEGLISGEFSEGSKVEFSEGDI
jgi:ATP-dependent Clp protease ATP-binding subunit ClpC